jgi:cytochrome c biogenesis protein CcmG/thiol:disulfide interchange protein DsbE
MTTRHRVLGLGGLLMAVVVVGALLASGLTRDPNVLPSVLVGRPAPDFQLTPLDSGRQVNLSELRGQVVVVNFWASWCLDCRIETPLLAGAWRRYRDAGVVVLGITFQDNADQARTYAAAHGLSYPTLEDSGSRVAIAYGVTGIPETYFIDRRGRVAAKSAGVLTAGFLDQMLAVLLSQ